MQTSIHVMRGFDSANRSRIAVSITFYPEKGYCTFSCNDQFFFQYLGDGVLFTNGSARMFSGTHLVDAYNYWDADGNEQQALKDDPEAMSKIIDANPAGVAKAIFQNITGREYPGGDVSVIFS
jgi:hypothetical protein